MRKTILILFIFLGSSLSFAQDNNISIKEYNYEYYHYYGTEKTYVWNLVITNNSAENYLTWINKNDNVMDYAEETQIKISFVQDALAYSFFGLMANIRKKYLVRHS